MADCPVNPDSNDVNQPLYSPVDHLKISRFWFEPNLGTGEVAATIKSSVKKNGTLQDSSAPENPIGAQRLWYDSGVGGNTWETYLDAVDIPASTNTEYYSNQQKRKVYTIVMWEDGARDDLNGPGPDITDFQ